MAEDARRRAEAQGAEKGSITETQHPEAMLVEAVPVRETGVADPLQIKEEEDDDLLEAATTTFRITNNEKFPPPLTSSPTKDPPPPLTPT
ncbi:hypothetical protein Dimus_033516 [Dionaea muscipula]